MQPQSSTSTTIKKKISLQDFQIKRIIGKGSYGDVFLAMRENQPFAMKEIIKKKLQREKKQYQALVERQLLRCMRHPGIIKLKYAFQDKNKLYFIMQYCHLGEFVRFMKQHIDTFTQEVRQFYIAEIVNLLEYLHTNGITHRDLKPQNLLLSKQGHLKLVDFGTSQITQCKILSQQFKEGIEKQKTRQVYEEEQIVVEEQQQEELMSPRKRRSTFVGTSYYISPQLLEQNVCEPPSDLWALGCIIYQLYYLETPFKDTTEYGVFDKIKKVQLEFPKVFFFIMANQNDIINEQAIDLIKKLLIKIPEQRLGSCSRQELDYKHLKEHPYFKGIDVDKVYSMVPPDIKVKRHNVESPQALEARKKDFIGLAIKMLDQSDKLEKKDQDKQGSDKKQEEGKLKILYQGALQRREFPQYQHCYMRIYSNSSVKLIKLDRPQTIEQYELEQRKQGESTNESVKIVDRNSGKFIIELKDKRKEVFKSENCELWAEKVNHPEKQERN